MSTEEMVGHIVDELETNIGPIIGGMQIDTRKMAESLNKIKLQLEVSNLLKMVEVGLMHKDDAMTSIEYIHINEGIWTY